MRQEIWRGSNGELQLMKRFRDDTFFGYIEVEEPKKTVTKEAKYHSTSRYPSGTTIMTVDDLPPNAKNVRILFDVEE